MPLPAPGQFRCPSAQYRAQGTAGTKLRHRRFDLSDRPPDQVPCSSPRDERTAIPCCPPDSSTAYRGSVTVDCDARNGKPMIGSEARPTALQSLPGGSHVAWFWDSAAHGTSTGDLTTHISENASSLYLDFASPSSLTSSLRSSVFLGVPWTRSRRRRRPDRNELQEPPWPGAGGRVHPGAHR